MGVSLQEVIEAGGYDLTTYEDAVWLLGKQGEFEDLIERVEEIVEEFEAKEREEAEAEYRKTFPEEE